MTNNKIIYINNEPLPMPKEVEDQLLIDIQNIEAIRLEVEKRKADKEAAIAKLEALGLSVDEISAVFGIEAQ